MRDAPCARRRPGRANGVRSPCGGRWVRVLPSRVVRLLIPAMLLLVGCTDPTGVTVHNGTDQAITVSGLPGGDVSIAPDEFVRTEVKAEVALSAKNPSGGEVGTQTVPLTVPGGESVWAVGAKGCFALGDFSPYYGPETVLLGIQLEKLMKPGEEFLAVNERVAAGPGRRLPSGHRGGKVLGLVRIPCKAAGSEGVARGWLELMLPEIEPEK